MREIRITGFANYLPEKVVGNEELPPIDRPLTPERVARIGVLERRWAGPEEGIAQMAAHAAESALARAGVTADQLDVVLVSNWSQRRYALEFAPLLTELIGARGVVALDVGCGCAGFVYALTVAAGLLQNPRFRRALVAGSETMSQRARPGTVATMIFADAAGAFVLEAGAGRGGPLIDYELACDGGRPRSFFEFGSDGYTTTTVAQSEVVETAGRSIREVTGRLLDRAHLSVEDVDWVVPHSGTAGVQARLCAELGVPRARMLTDYATVGNVSSASIPTAITRFADEGTIKPDDLILSPAVGGGWYAGAVLYRLGASI